MVIKYRDSYFFNDIIMMRISIFFRSAFIAYLTPFAKTLPLATDDSFRPEFRRFNNGGVLLRYVHFNLVHGSHLEQRLFAGTKWLGRYQVQASRFIAQVIVLVVINAMIRNDWKIGIMEESKKSQYKYCLIVKIEKF